MVIMALARTIMLFIALVSTAIVILYAQKSKRPILKCTASAVCGAAALGAVNLLASYTGVGLVINYFSAFISIVLGVPGVILLLALRVLLIL